MDPHSFWSAGSGSRRTQMTHKSEELSSFEVVDHVGDIFCVMKTSPSAGASFMEA